MKRLKIWGIFLILAGLLFIFNGFLSCSLVELQKKEINSTKKYFNTTQSDLFPNSMELDKEFDAIMAHELEELEKIKSSAFWSFFISIAFLITGCFLMKGINPKYYLNLKSKNHHPVSFKFKPDSSDYINLKFGDNPSDDDNWDQTFKADKEYNVTLITDYNEDD